MQNESNEDAKVLSMPRPFELRPLGYPSVNAPLDNRLWPSKVCWMTARQQTPQLLSSIYLRQYPAPSACKMSSISVGLCWSKLWLYEMKPHAVRSKDTSQGLWDLISGWLHKVKDVWCKLSSNPLRHKAKSDSNAPLNGQEVCQRVCVLN